ncbi:LysM peptidoglycan-binding domain-containing protein [Desulforamulus hydrothermalis]|uniref:Peptidoglycan-binding LysM n=1 Tax=Desulforamulus hydrothermalis Lam5 = DSM 18033 TaxID=1121428 RepID=K8E7C0_9FIRM
MIFNKKIVCSFILAGLLFFNNTAFAGNFYTVKKGDSLWSISQAYGTTVEELKRANRLTGDNLSIGQRLLISYPVLTSRGPAKSPLPDWLAVTSAVPAADQASQVSQDQQPTVELVDWFTEGKKLLQSGVIFSVADCATGAQLQLKVLSAGNHCDIEPASQADTNAMLRLFGQWTWSPRPVVIQINGRRIAGSLSGMPHSIDTTPDNGVEGHFDLYLHNSRPHGSGVSQSYVQQHYAAVAKSAGSDN